MEFVGALHNISDSEEEDIENTIPTKKRRAVYSIYEKEKEFNNLDEATHFIKTDGQYRYRTSSESAEGQKRFYPCALDGNCSSKIQLLLNGILRTYNLILSKMWKM